MHFLKKGLAAVALIISLILLRTRSCILLLLELLYLVLFVKECYGNVELSNNIFESSWFRIWYASLNTD